MQGDFSLGKFNVTLGWFSGRPIRTLVDSIADLAPMECIPCAYPRQHPEWHHNQLRAHGRDR